MKLWILTSCLNEYDQHGEYFCAAWAHKPTKDELTGMVSADIAEHLLATGGGRREFEYEWFYLREVDEGQYWDSPENYYNQI